MFWIFMLLGAAGLHVMWKRRAFQRTNESGVERFASYSAQVGAKSIDRLLKFGSLLLLAAGVLMLSYLHVDTWGWVVIAPVLAFALYLFIGA
jgi:Ca2+/Na+ antiporter